MCPFLIGRGDGWFGLHNGNWDRAYIPFALFLWNLFALIRVHALPVNLHILVIPIRIAFYTCCDWYSSSGNLLILVNIYIFPNKDSKRGSIFWKQMVELFVKLSALKVVDKFPLDRQLSRAICARLEKYRWKNTFENQTGVTTTISPTAVG